MAEVTSLARVEEAAALLKSGNRTQAYRLLKQVIRDDPVEWRAWWGLAHATTSPQERLAALKKTVQLNPSHDKANKLLAKAQSQQATQAAPAPAQPTESWQTASPFDSGTYAGDPSPFESDTYTGDPSPFEGVEDDGSNPFAYQVYEIIDKPAADPWDLPPKDSLPTRKAAPAKKGSSTDKLINAAIVIVGMLVVAGILILILPRVDLQTLFRPVGASAPPNYFDGGDPYRTTGGGTLILNGEPVTDRVTELDEAHNWAFEAEAGQIVTIRARAIGETDPRVTLLDPDGNYLAENDDGGLDHGMGMWDSYLVYEIPRKGAYTIRVDIFTGGQFTLQVSSN